MELFNINANDLKHREKTHVCSTFKSRSELILDQIHTLPLHFKLVLYACIRLLSQDTNNGKATLMDVYIEYRRLTDELNITSPPMSRIHELARELETLGFLKCTYPRKRDGRVGYVQIFEPAQIPRYASILKEDLGLVMIEEGAR